MGIASTCAEKTPVLLALRMEEKVTKYLQTIAKKSLRESSAE